MKIFVKIMFAFALAVSLLTGCAKTSTDDAFISALEKGLMARWI